MPLLRDAEARIAYVVGTGPYRGTPNTITGDSTHVQSYELVIGVKVSETKWMIHGERNSMTTNRHIHALENYLESQGIEIEYGTNLWVPHVVQCVRSVVRTA